MKKFIYNEWKAQTLQVIEEAAGEDLTEDGIDDIIRHEIDNAVIYYADAWAIAYELADSDWSDMAADFGEITNICQLAYAALYDKVQNDYQMTGENLIDYLKTQA